MDLVLAGLQWTSCLMYLDNIIIPGKIFEDHLRNQATLVKRLRKVGLKSKPSKSSLCQLQVTFLGPVLSARREWRRPASDFIRGQSI